MYSRAQVGIHTRQLLDGVVKLLGLLSPAPFFASKGTEQSVGTVHFALSGCGIILQSLLLGHCSIKRCLQHNSLLSHVLTVTIYQPTIQTQRPLL